MSFHYGGKLQIVTFFNFDIISTALTDLRDDQFAKVPICKVFKNKCNKGNKDVI